MGTPRAQLLGALWAFLLIAPVPSTGRCASAHEVLRPGARVRLTLLETPGHMTRQRIFGLLVSADQENVVVSVSPGEPGRVVALDELYSLEVIHGRRGRAGRGALIGLGAGAAGGVAAALIGCADGDCDTGESGDLTGAVVFVLGAGGALFGAGVGALIGGRFHTDRWERVSLRELRMGLEPQGDGARLRFSFALP